MGGAGEGRERLELEDFETPDGVEFDPVRWLNARLAKSGVTFDKLDQHLLSLGMSCQLLCQDTSESIEVASNQLVAQLPTTGRDLERMHQETLRGRGRLATVLNDLREADDRKRSGLHGLAEIDAVKSRVETAYSALREVGSWDRKVRDCDQMVHSNNLTAALAQLSSLKGVLDAFRMLPEYSKKEEQLGQLEESLLTVTRRRTRLAFEKGSAGDLRACSEVFAGLGRMGEPASMATAVFLELAERSWQAAPAASGAAAAAAAAGAVLSAVAGACEERWPLLQALDHAAVPSAGDGDPSPATSTGQASPKEAVMKPPVLVATDVLTSAVQAALGFLSGRVEACLSGGATAEVGGEEASAHARAARAVGLLAAYVDGLGRLAACTPMAANSSLWAEVCRGSAAGEVLPWALLREVAHHVVWRGMQDDAVALVPPVHRELRPSEAVLAAESNAKRFLQMPGTWAKRLEQQGAGQLAVLWLAGVDETCAWYWTQWDQLIETFENTLHLRRHKEGEARSAESAHDAALLNECLQLHGMLHGSLSQQFTGFRAEALMLAARLQAAPELPAFGHAALEKLRAPGQWCDKFVVPSPAALRSSLASLEGAETDAASLHGRSDRALPAAASALAAAEKKVRSLVTQCCVQPVAAVLGAYSEAPEWSLPDGAADAAPAMAGGLLPLPAVTAVGEHLFSLVPQLEQPQEGAQVRWLPLVLEAVVDVATQRALLIKQLTGRGAQQLAVDLEYLQKVTDALGSSEAAVPTDAAPGSASPAARVGELLTALAHLAAQQRRRQQCLAKGEDFREEPREGPPLERRAEKALRAALGLPA